MRKPVKIVFGAILLTLLLAGLVGGEWGWQYYYDHKKPNFSQEAVIYVYPDASPAEVVDSIAVKAGVLKRESLARAFHSVGAPQPGRYVVEPSMSSYALARRIAAGEETPMNLVIAPNYRTAADLAAKMGAQLMIGADSIAAALKDPAFLSKYGFTPETALAMVLPDTYNIKWSVSLEGLFDRLQKEYRRYWDGERTELAAAQGLSPVEAAVLASIVNEETKYGPEMPLVAGVYLNRLHCGMLLQADPTVAYCFDYSLTRVLNKHLAVDSPYNTYKYAGLPPGPISCSPKVCIEAVLHPKGDNLYFCASPAFDGTHRFARTLSEHNRNADAYRRALSKR